MRKDGGLKLVMTEEMASGSYAAHVTDEMAFIASMPHADEEMTAAAFMPHADGEMTAVPFMPHVMREMTSAEYWISKVRDPDRVLADEGQIKALNKEIVGVPGCHLRDMLQVAEHPLSGEQEADPSAFQKHLLAEVRSYLSQFFRGDSFVASGDPFTAERPPGTPRMQVAERLPGNPQMQASERPPGTPQMQATERPPGIVQMQASERPPGTPRMQASERLPAGPLCMVYVQR